MEEKKSQYIKPKILVVDDIRSNIESMKSILKQYNCEVHGAYSGNEALSLMIRNQYALVLSDILMPDMDGFELARLMRMQPETMLIPIIFVSAERKNEVNMYQGYESGALDYIFKPLDKKILLYKINIILDLYNQIYYLKQKLDECKNHHRSNSVLPNKISSFNSTKITSCPRILIVDDRKENLVALQQILKKVSVEILMVQSGPDAIDLVKKNELSLILLDVQMPGMDGFEVAQQINKLALENPIPIIFITAINKEEKHVFKGYASGAVDYIFKPVEPSLLISKVKIFITLHKSRLILTQLLGEKEILLSDIKAKNEQLSYLAFHDTLTMVGNRGGFEDTLEKKFSTARRHLRKFALLFIDVNHFKIINDSYGHDHGDLLLQEIAKRIKGCLRTIDYIARIGGDEFAIILDEIKEYSDAGEVAKKILETLSKTFSIFNKAIKASISIGIACYPQESGDEVIKNSKILIRNADIAMFRAKARHKNIYEFYSKKYSEEHRNRVLIENHLKFALERNEFFLVYQPQINLANKKLEGVEALLRWQHPEKGLISPDRFIPILEDTQMIVPVGEWIIRKVFEQAIIWHKKMNLQIKIGINVSAYQLINQGFKGMIRSLLKEYDINPKMIEFELTETAVMDDASAIKDALFQLNDFEFNISIDDFGTGYSMLSYLKKLPISSLKIDAEFVKDLHLNESSAMIVRAIIDLAKNFKLNVIAEGVELPIQEAFLIEHGCQYAQGYLYSQPISPNALLKLLKT